MSGPLTEHLNALLSKIAEAEAHMMRAIGSVTWQPIETAPRDGTVILLCHSFSVLCGYASSVRPQKIIAIGYYDSWWVTGVPGGHSSGGDDKQFTHWMPRPEPPAS